MAGGWLVAAGAAFAQPYPSKPVRMIIPFGAGGSTDVVIRIVAAKLPDVLGQQVVIDNRTGAGSMIGTDIAAKSTPDGYTVLATGSPHAIVPNLYKKVPYDAQKDFAPVMQIGSQPYGLVVHPSLGVKSVKDLIALAKKEPGKHNYASSGQGGAMHLFQAMFASMANINIVHIPYKGSGPVRADLLGGQVKIGCLGLSSILPQHKAGLLRIIAVTTAKRSPELPDIPSIAETIPGYDAALWTGLLVPRGTPAVAVKRLHQEVSKLLQTPEIKTAFDRVGTDIVATDPATFGEFLKVEHQKWGKVVRDLKLTVN
ncbi:MAG: tripartite tricarboxylate transporter substrate binding protein [Betaproteobacteria bacterium]|nr:tripartite tricarboxylate transporter substrate binding protein [Betaproteobacteria bacterium]MBI2508633.1 tripartite tricarboxylate transporter substrate binding protein [Betaproteobacteria bacterium]